MKDDHEYVPADPTANPVGTDGFEFVEFAAPDPKILSILFANMGFTHFARHKTQAIDVWRQGDINFIINAEPKTHAAQFVAEHGPCASAMAFRVKDAVHAEQYLLQQGAKPFRDASASWLAAKMPAIYGIGDSLLFCIDRYGKQSIYDDEFDLINKPEQPSSVGLTYIDHLTHNVYQGNMDRWANFYVKLFNFRQIRYFDIQGKYTGLLSRAMSSPCNKIRIPLNESADDKSQIAEYLVDYHGEGIQHIALGCDDIYHTIETMRAEGQQFMSVPDTYYEMLDKRLPGHGEPMARLQKDAILVDGDRDSEQAQWELLLQIFTNTVIGPIFFEIIQRKGNEGFGEGNFQALFDSIELDQIRRGVL